MRNKLKASTKLPKEAMDLWEKFRDAAQPVFEEIRNELTITCISCYPILPADYRDKLDWELKA